VSELFQEKYRIASARLPNWDYTQDGYYFVTICTRDHGDYLGRIEKETVVLSKIGHIAHCCWQEIGGHFDHVVLDDFVIMPDHIHGIVIINYPIGCEPTSINDPRRDAINRVSTVSRSTVSQQTTSRPVGGCTQTNNPMLHPKSLSSIMRWYKGRCTFEIHKQHPDTSFAWQPRFYDHIIRNEKELHKIRLYIRHNPLKSQIDHQHHDNIVC
jgi:REP element-mobilizing transposase RayT